MQTKQNTDGSDTDQSREQSRGIFEFNCGMKDLTRINEGDLNILIKRKMHEFHSFSHGAWGDSLNLIVRKFTSPTSLLKTTETEDSKILPSGYLPKYLHYFPYMLSHITPIT